MNALDFGLLIQQTGTVSTTVVRGPSKNQSCEVRGQISFKGFRGDGLTKILAHDVRPTTDHGQRSVTFIAHHCVHVS